MFPSPPHKRKNRLDEERAWKRALYFLGIKSRTAKEIERYLEMKGFCPSTVAGIVQRLEKEGYLNDRDLAGRIVSKAKEKGWGWRRTAQELLKRGINGSLAQEALSEGYRFDELEVALDQGRKKLNSLPPSMAYEKMESKVAMHLDRRGFPPPVILEALNRLREEQQNVPE